MAARADVNYRCLASYSPYGALEPTATAGHTGPPGVAGQREQQALFVAFAIAAENPERFWGAESAA